MYQGQVRELFKRFEPYVGEEYDGKKVDWPQKVLISEKAIPQDRIQPNTTVTGTRMWDAQEDIWLVRLLADVVTKMNAQAEGINKAAIRKIDRLQLFGGSGEPQISSAASGYGESDMADYENAPAYGGYGSAGAGTAQSKVDFRSC